MSIACPAVHVCPLAHLRNCTLNFNFFMPVTCDRGLVILLWWCFDTLYTSGCMDDVMFSLVGGGPRKHVNTTAATLLQRPFTKAYWLRSVLDDGECRDQTSPSRKGLVSRGRCLHCGLHHSAVNVGIAGDRETVSTILLQYCDSRSQVQSSRGRIT